MTDLRALAESVGIAPRWQNYRNEWQEVSEEALQNVLNALGYPAATDAQVADSRARLAELRSDLPPLVTAGHGEPLRLPVVAGAYELAMEDGSRRSGVLEAATGGAVLPGIEQPGYHTLETAGRRTIVAVAPRHGVTASEMGRPWALAVQLYALRRPGDGGVGDFEALRRFAAPAARHGAAGIAISPVHAQFSADPDRFSPYSPSSRISLNVLHAAIDQPDADDGGTLVDWPAASRRRLAALRAEFESASPADLQSLEGFREAMGDTLETHARFEALHAEQFGQHGRWHWQTWPDELRHPRNPAVEAFARDHEREIAYHAYMQWRADSGLAAAHAAAREAGMKIGLIADLAVGADSGGSHCWARQDQILQGLSIGAPPDLLNGSGQNWGLAAFSPTGLRVNGFGAFLEMLRAAMRNAGGVRIDHALGLRRLWVVPDGHSSREGAYLAFPQTDLLRLIALESHRSRTIVIGEDLGTIPSGFQEELATAGVLGMRVLWFERNPVDFVAPRDWTRAAVAMTGTHDLATLSGWWRGRDLEWRARLGLAGNADAAAQEGHERFRDRFMLWDAMRASGAAHGDPPPNEEPARFVDAATRYVAGAASDLMILPVEDALALDEQPNLPGTMSEQHPNWQRRLPGPAETLLDAPEVAQRLRTIGDIRAQ